MTHEDELKRAVSFAAVDRYVRDGTCIGLGTGSTARWAIVRVGERVARGEREIDVAIDGADEVAADWSLTKGGGGAQFREKAVALAARAFVVVVTPEKLVERLGAFATPVEVVPFTLRTVTRAIEAVHPAIRIVRRAAR